MVPHSDSKPAPQDPDHAPRGVGRASEQTEAVPIATIRDEDLLARVTSAAGASDSARAGSGDAPDRASLYVPRILQQQLADDPDVRCWLAEGTAALVDISGFTKLSERLSRKGREGAEHITDAISGCFESILLVAYDHGGSLLKFGGDALLLWFSGDGHAARACLRCRSWHGLLSRGLGCAHVPLHPQHHLHHVHLHHLHGPHHLHHLHLR